MSKDNQSIKNDGHNKDAILHIVIAKPEGGARQISRNIADVWAMQGGRVRLSCFLDGDLPHIDNVEIISQLDLKYPNAKNFGRFKKALACFSTVFCWFWREKPSKIIVNGLPLAMPVMGVRRMFFWRTCQIAVIADTHVSAHLSYKKTCKNSWAFRVISRWTHNQSQYRGLMKRVDGVIALSNVIAYDLRDRFGLDKDKCHTISPVIKDDYFDSILPNKRPSNRFLYIGRLSKEKNLPDLIQAFYKVHQKNKQAKLIIVGDGEEKHSLEKMVRKLTLEKMVEFCGYQTNIIGYHDKATVQVLCSHYEGLPTVLLEALANGVPVITYDGAFTPRAYIADDENGFVVTHYDVDELAQVMADSLEIEWNPETIRRSVMDLHPDNVRAQYIAFLNLFMETV